MLSAGHALYGADIARATHLSRAQVTSVISSLVAMDIIRGIGPATAGRARRFVVTDADELKDRVNNPHKHGGGTVAGRKMDFGPLVAAWGWL